MPNQLLQWDKYKKEAPEIELKKIETIKKFMYKSIKQEFNLENILLVVGSRDDWFDQVGEKIVSASLSANRIGRRGIYITKDFHFYYAMFKV